MDVVRMIDYDAFHMLHLHCRRQMIMPNISFMGHLSGILTGMLLVFGCLQCLMPSTGKVCEVDYRFQTLIQPHILIRILQDTPAGVTQFMILVFKC
jgi:hypothetical protein